MKASHCAVFAFLCSNGGSINYAMLYPGLFFFVSFFSAFLIRDVVAKSLAPWWRESRQESPMVQTERKAAPQSARLFVGYGLQ